LEIDGGEANAIYRDAAAFDGVGKDNTRLNAEPRAGGLRLKVFDGSQFFDNSSEHELLFQPGLDGKFVRRDGVDLYISE
jgi:hypothetical protein